MHSKPALVILLSQDSNTIAECEVYDNKMSDSKTPDPEFVNVVSFLCKAVL